MSNDALWATYASTILLIGRAPQIKVDLRLPVSDEHRHLLTNLGLGSTFAIVTPYDPRGVRTAGWKNRRRHLRARALLRSRDVKLVRADGESPDRSHRERGFAIAMSRSEAAVLARELDQLALYWFDGDAFWIDGALATITPLRLP